MQALGAEVLVIAPQDWDEQGKRQVHDQLDASVMCRRLSDYLCGHRKALSIVHIPSPEEEARRAQGRLREQLRRHLARMRAMGRSLLLQRELVVKGRWLARPPTPASPFRLLGGPRPIGSASRRRCLPGCSRNSSSGRRSSR